jgi:anti-sigma-K factor RskA
MNVFDLSDKVYDKIKWVVTIALPALGTLYVALSQLWGWGNADQVTATIVVVCTFLGTLLGISSKRYETPTIGELMVVGDDQSVVVAFDEDPEELSPGATVTFRVGQTLEP